MGQTAPSTGRKIGRVAEGVLEIVAHTSNAHSPTAMRLVARKTGATVRAEILKERVRRSDDGPAGHKRADDASGIGVPRIAANDRRCDLLRPFGFPVVRHPLKVPDGRGDPCSFGFEVGSGPSRAKRRHDRRDCGSARQAGSLRRFTTRCHARPPELILQGLKFELEEPEFRPPPRRRPASRNSPHLHYNER